MVICTVLICVSIHHEGLHSYNSQHVQAEQGVCASQELVCESTEHGDGDHGSRARLPQEQEQWHTGETQERDQHEAILIGCDSGLLFEMALHQH